MKLTIERSRTTQIGSTYHKTSYVLEGEDKDRLNMEAELDSWLNEWESKLKTEVRPVAQTVEKTGKCRTCGKAIDARYVYCYVHHPKT